MNPGDAEPVRRSAVRIDHVLFAVDDFATAAARLWDDYGLAAVEGGRHSGWGTANWIVPLGSAYLELAGIIDAETATASAFGRRVAAALAGGGGPFAWCVVPDDLEATAERLGLEVGTGSRKRPDGSVLSWRSAGLDVALSDPSRPFFLEWLVPASLHPGAEEVPHRLVPLGISWVEVAGDDATVRYWLGDDSVPVRLQRGEPGIRAIGIATRGGPEVVIRR